MNDQLIFKRYELKYMLTQKQAALITQAFENRMTADVHGRNTLFSLYFDTPDYLLARRSLEHPLYKEKLRLRSYGVAASDTTVFMEIKKKYDSIVYKRRIAVTNDEAECFLSAQLPAANTQIGHEIAFFMHRYRNLAPRILLSYEREAFYDNSDHSFRITFDRNLLWRTDELNLTSGAHGSPLMSREQVLMEVKTGGAIPMWFARLLSENHIYKTSFSKYGSAYGTLSQSKGGIYHYA